MAKEEVIDYIAIFKEAFEVYASRYQLLIGISALSAGVMFIGEMVKGISLFLYMIVALFSVFALPFVSIMMLRAVSLLYLDKPVEWDVLIDVAFKKIWRLIGAGLLIACCFFVAGFVVGIILMTVSKKLGLLVVLILCLVAMIFYNFVPAVITLEDAGPWASLLRSKELMWGRYFYKVLLMFGLIFLVTLLPSIIYGWLGKLEHLTQGPTKFVTYLYSVLIVPYTSALIVNVYYRLKLYREG